MKYGLDVSITREYADPRTLSTLALEAELAGWDGFFIQDYLIAENAILDPCIALTAIALQTERVRVGTLMTALPRRRPWKVARETVTLDHLSNGRLIFGAGLGFNPHDFTAFGETADLRVRAEKLEEGLAVLTGLWSGEPFRFEGKYYQVDAVQFLPRPVQVPRIPIWMAGGWPNRRPFRRAALWDGVYIMTNKVTGELLTPDDIREIVAYINTYRPNSDPFDIVFAGETPDDHEKRAELIQGYADAGVTWWLEGIWDALDEKRKRIRSGPLGA